MAGSGATWALDHVSVPAYDLTRSVAFYRDVIGLPEAPGSRGRADLGGRESARFLSPIAGELHLTRPDPTIARERGSFIDPHLRGHASIRVPDLDIVRAELARRAIYFADEELWPIDGCRRIFALDPSMNCIEITERLGPAERVEHDIQWKLEHIFAPAHDVRASATFYSEVVGMTEVQFPAKREGRGAFSVAPDALAYFPDPTRAHVDVLRPSPVFGRDNDLYVNPLSAPHVAIQVPDISEVKKRLDLANVFYGDAGHFALQGLYQLYLYDPAMNLVEICQPVA